MGRTRLCSATNAPCRHDNIDDGVGIPAGILFDRRRRHGESRLKRPTQGPDAVTTPPNVMVVGDSRGGRLPSLSQKDLSLLSDARREDNHPGRRSSAKQIYQLNVMDAKNWSNPRINFVFVIHKHSFVCVPVNSVCVGSYNYSVCLHKSSA